MSDNNQAQQPQSDSQVSFMNALFDFRFQEWVTLRIAGFLYAFFIGIVSLFALYLVVLVLIEGLEFALVLGSLIGIALLWFLSILLYRLVIESAIATIKVADNTSSLRK